MQRIIQLLVFPLLLCVALVACTPAYIQQNSKELATQTRLMDSIDIERSNSRLLSHQAQICLIGGDTDTDAGLTVLRAMQAAFGGYFVAVGVENEAMDYLRALASASCPGATYLFYVQPSGPPTACPDNNAACTRTSHSQFVITIINSSDRTLADRIKFSIKKGFLPFEKNDQQRLQKGFEQLAIELTGAR